LNFLEYVSLESNAMETERTSMTLRKTLSVMFLTALVANVVLVSGCKDEEGTSDAPAETAPPAEETAPADQGAPADESAAEEAPAEGAE
jgi:hypothetical protein